MKFYNLSRKSKHERLKQGIGTRVKEIKINEKAKRNNVKLIVKIKTIMVMMTI